jgi:transposase
MKPLGSCQKKRRRKTIREKNKEVTAAKRADLYQQMVTLQKQGLRSDAIAPLVGVSARTVRRWLAEGIEKGVRQKRPSPLDAFALYIYQRIRAGGPTGKQLYEELQSLGYTGSLTSFYQYLDRWKRPDTVPDLPVEQEPEKRPVTTSFSNPFELYEAKQMAWMHFRKPDDLTAQESDQLAFIQQVHPSFERAYGLVQDFVAMIRNRKENDLDSWLERAKTSRIAEMIRFAKGIEQDKSAVQAALQLPYSNGLVEGHVHRLKLIKRQGYGRASFSLLRQSVLYQAQ